MCKKKDEDHFQAPLQSFDSGIQIFLPTTPKIVQTPHLPFVTCFADLAAQNHYAVRSI